MRKRNFVVAAVLGVIGALALSGVAQAAPVSPHGFTLTAGPAKQDKKARNGISLNANIDEQFSGGSLATGPASSPCPVPSPTGCTYFPPAVRSQFFLAREFRFTTGRLASDPCSTGQISTATAAAARSAAVCGSSLIGTGSVVIKTLAGQSLFGQVSAFVSGARQILIHIDVPSQTNKPVLVGNLLPPATLDVTLQPVQGTVIDDINLIVNKKKVSTKKQDKAGKRKFFVSANCADGTWESTQLTTFQGGSTSAGTPVTQKCKKLPPKK
jgi:hypothetical protein